MPDAFARDVGPERDEQAGDNLLVPQTRGRRHQQLAVHGLVARPVTRLVDEGAYHLSSVVQRVAPHTLRCPVRRYVIALSPL